MIQAAYLKSLKEGFRFNRLIIWVLLALGGAGVGLMWVDYSNKGSLQDAYSQVASFMVFRLLALASVIISSTVISADVEQKTIVYLLTRPIPRWNLLLGRYLGSVTIVAFFGILFAIFTSLGVYKGEFLHNPSLWPTCLAAILGAFAYGALFVFFSLILNKSILVGLLFAFGWETAIPNLPGDSFWFSIYTHLGTVSRMGVKVENAPDASLIGATVNANTLTLSDSVLVLIISTLVLVGLSLVWFSFFEYVPREDAG